jgi:hypothetical protein
VAEDVAAGSAPRPAPERPAVERPDTSRAERAHRSGYYTRFSFAYMLLIMVGVLGVGALVIVLVHPGAAHKPPWSKFKPTGSPVAMQRQIATQVSSEYKSSTTDKLVNVIPGGLAATKFVQSASGTQSVQVPITSIAVEPDVSKGQHETSDITFMSPGSTVAYEMCGFGSSQQNCGVSSISRSDPEGLLRREAIELALYTLKYVPGTNAVITYLPPPANQQVAAKAILTVRKDVKRNLDRPLTQTLKPQEVELGTGVPDGASVGQLTASHVYTSSYQTLPDGTSVLVLTPASA